MTWASFHPYIKDAMGGAVILHRMPDILTEINKFLLELYHNIIDITKMPPPEFQDIPAYRIYASYASRPRTVGPWRKNNQGKLCIESGELMCRYEIDGAICPNTSRFKSRIELGRHVRENHDLLSVAYGSVHRRNQTQLEHLTAYYTDLVQIMRQDPLAVEPPVRDPIPHPVPQPVPRNVSNEQREEPEDDDQEASDQNLHNLPSPPATQARAPAAGINRIRSFGVTELPSEYNFLNPRPRPPSPPSRLPASLKPKFDLHDDWDLEVLKQAKVEDKKVVRRATSESWDRSLVDRIHEARENAEKRQPPLS